MFSINVTKRARTCITTFAVSIADNLRLLQQYKWNTIIITLPQLIINIRIKVNEAFEQRPPLMTPQC